MYAAAGGASLASRQARQKQRKQNTERIEQINKLKLGQHKQRQFQNYTDSKIKISRGTERNLLKPQLAEHRRHSTAHLKEVTSRARIKESPSILLPIHGLHQASAHHAHHHTHAHAHALIPRPLTPIAPPPDHPFHEQLPQIVIPDGEDKLERRCSFVRQVEEMEQQQLEGVTTDVTGGCNHAHTYDMRERPSFGDIGHYYSEFHRSAFGSLDYPFSECSQGRAAWQERQGGRRCSLSEEAHQHRLRSNEAHHRWMKRNRIHDSSYPGESDENIFAAYQQSAAANALLYAGLGTTAIGSVVFFVGSGDKGFKTLELRLIGPTLVACGLLCCLIRVLLCACPSACFRRGKAKTRFKASCPHGSRSWPSEKRRERTNPDFVQVESATTNEKQKKRVSIAQTQPLAEPGPSNWEGDHHNGAPSLPQINVLEFADFQTEERASIELQNLEISFDLQSLSSEEGALLGDITVPTPVPPPPITKLTRTRVPVHAASTSAGGGRELDAAVTATAAETCLSVTTAKSRDDHKPPSTSHSGILLSPLQLEQ